jgi:nucleoprotein TPR
MQAIQQAEATSSNVESSEQSEKLQQDLFEAQTEIESLRASATINASIANAPTEDGSKSVADQIAEQAESIRAELSSQYDIHFQQAEEKFKRRSDNMKDQLNTKLREAKQNARKEVAAEHEAALEKLKAEHKLDLDRLNLQLSTDIQRIKSEEQVKLAQEKQIWLAENAAAAPTAPTPDSKTPQSPSIHNLSDVEARRLVATNETIKSIVRNNIMNQLAKARIDQETALEQKLAEAQTKSNAAKDQAVAMEGKKYAVKLSMTENKSKSTSAKLGVIEKAATETPDRAVSEVWKIAKDTKPAPSIPATQNATQAIGSPGILANTVGNRGASTQPQPPATNGVPNSLQVKREATGSQSAVPDTAPAPTQTSAPAPSTGDQPSAVSNGQSEQTAPTSGIPTKAAPPLANTNAGTGPKALQGILPPGHTAIPRSGATSARARGGGRGGQANQAPGTGLPQPGSTRGSGLPRGGGRGRGRGGSQGVQTTGLPQQQATESPTSGRGGLNANARQFVPTGNKRARESEGDDGAAGKRARGGGAGN